MENNSKYYTMFICVAILAIITLIINSQNKGFDKVLENINSSEYYGTVEKRFIDGDNHNEPTIILSTGKKVLLYSNEYIKINIGDSLAKKKNTTILNIIKKDTTISIDRKIHVDYLKMKNK